MLWQGSAEAYKKSTDDADGDFMPVYFYDQGDWFGEIAVLEKKKRQASIKVTSEFAGVLMIDSATLGRFMGRFNQMFQDQAYSYLM